MPMQLKGLNLEHWITTHRSQLKPPVGNLEIWPNEDFIIMAVAGPNARNDFHVNTTAEIFYQLEGTIEIKVIDEGIKTVTLGAGEMFVLPANVPHSPQRPENTLGIVVEQKRPSNVHDHFQWYCEQCGERLYEIKVHVTDIVSQLPIVFDQFYDHPSHSTCKQCGARLPRPTLSDR